MTVSRPGCQNARTASAQLAVAEIRHAEIFQVAPERRRVGLDRVRGHSQVARAVIGAGAEIDRAFEGNAEEDDAGARVRIPTRDEPRISRLHGENLIQGSGGSIVRPSQPSPRGFAPQLELPRARGRVSQRSRWAPIAALLNEVVVG